MAGNSAFVGKKKKKRSISVVQSKLTGWHFGCDVALIRQLAVRSHVIAFGSEEGGEEE